jgi:alpha-ketoglutarate-dependent taurine dioxygenase
LGDLNEEDTETLMKEVEAFCTQPQFVYAHKWRKGDVVMWDNLCTMHSATPFDEKYDRIINRTQTVYEVRPQAA